MRRKLPWLLLPVLLLLLAALAATLEQLNRTPRELAPYIEKRASGHNEWIVAAGNWLGRSLRALDRMEPLPYSLPSLKAGAQDSAGGTVAADAHLVQVDSVEQVRKAIAQARPGDVITFLPGVYHFANGDIIVNRPGSASAPITVRAAQPGTVLLEMAVGEGFRVSAPYWIFENLQLRGVCKVQHWCEHAFHVVGNAHHFVARNNRIVDFSSHIKVNMEDGRIPDDGVLEHNTLSNTATRHTEHSVTVIDVVAASRWRIRGNLISDFVKDYSDKVSYGAFVKGAGADNRIEQNVIVCEYRLRGRPGQRVGISLGGGGTGQEYCRDRRCITEQDRGVVESNLVVACSDDGIYLNRAAASRISNNTLLDTGGIEIRYPESSAEVVGNLVDGKIRTRDGGLLRAGENIDTGMSSLFLGYHPVRRLFRDAAVLDLSWRNAPAAIARTGPLAPDLCGAQRTDSSPPGAFDDFGRCLNVR